MKNTLFHLEPSEVCFSNDLSGGDRAAIRGPGGGRPGGPTGKGLAGGPTGKGLAGLPGKD